MLPCLQHGDSSEDSRGLKNEKAAAVCDLAAQSPGYNFGS